MKKGYTIAELIIVIAIILILSTAAISGSAGLIRSLRFTNSFNKMVFMVQQARSLAVTGKGSAANYDVQLGIATNTISIGSSTAVVREILETFTLEATTNLTFFASHTDGTCSTSATIQFERGAAKTSLVCDAVNPPPSLFTVGVREVEAGVERRSKTFSIHQASGIPQISN